MSPQRQPRFHFALTILLLLQAWALYPEDLQPPAGGSLELTNLSPNLEIEVGDAQKGVFLPETWGQYSLPPGEYWVKCRPKDDIAWLWTWVQKVMVSPGSAVSLVLPDPEQIHSLIWQQSRERENNLALRAELKTLLRAREASQNAQSWGFWVGGLSGAGAAAVYLWGTQAMNEYNSTTDPSRAAALHQALVNAGLAVVVQATIAAVGLGVGSASALTAPRLDSIQKDLQASDERLKAFGESGATQGGNP